VRLADGYGVWMPVPATGLLRLVRAGSIAVVTVALAALAHVLAGGPLPPAVVLAALTALALAAAVVLTARRVGPLGVLALLGVGQLAVHSAFSLFTTMSCLPTSAVQGGSLAHQHHPGMVMGPSAACTAVDVQPLLGSSSMLGLHVAAAVVAALVLAGADRALWWLAAWLSPLFGTSEPAVVVPLPSLPTPADVPVPGRARWRDTVPLRGPPAWHSPVIPPH
jgi:hypothetical protein